MSITYALYDDEVMLCVHELYDAFSNLNWIQFKGPKRNVLMAILPLIRTRVFLFRSTCLHRCAAGPFVVLFPHPPSLPLQPRPAVSTHTTHTHVLLLCCCRCRCCCCYDTHKLLAPPGKRSTCRRRPFPTPLLPSFLPARYVYADESHSPQMRKMPPPKIT